MTKRLIMGKNCLSEVLSENPTSIQRVYTSKKDSQDDLLEKLIHQGIFVKRVSKESLYQMVRSESHQSYVAEITPKPKQDLRSFLEKDQEGIVLMLDEIYDPQNFGSILRSCECFGALGAIYSKNRGTSITPVVSKSSVGASELITLIEVSNLATTVDKFKDAGYYVVTTEVGADTTSLYSFEFPEKTLLIMGSEGQGIQPLLRKKADFKIYIPMLGKIDSLNVSQATAVLLSHFNKSL